MRFVMKQVYSFTYFVLEQVYTFTYFVLNKFTGTSLHIYILCAEQVYEKVTRWTFKGTYGPFMKQM